MIISQNLLNNKLPNTKYDLDQRMNVEDINKNISPALCLGRIINDYKTTEENQFNSSFSDRSNII